MKFRVGDGLLSKNKLATLKKSVPLKQQNKQKHEFLNAFESVNGMHLPTV